MTQFMVAAAVAALTKEEVGDIVIGLDTEAGPKVEEDLIEAEVGEEAKEAEVKAMTNTEKAAEKVGAGQKVRRKSPPERVNQKKEKRAKVKTSLF